ncbi:hypothetical protein CIB84_003311 [Bambusicola thoracicus]|uniref:Ig-like domain-containing protein n=1 Tax=Bambusicola thoracicus TaxID=9083 RepID=A0A2P4T9B9_BAMTH|nr:hypothetical protein CIB84_003311 [Bambusicola thoracicus]
MMLFLWSVSANYSQPVIAQLHTGEPKPNEDLNLSCSSSGGYPEPKQMIWLISSENITDRLIRHMDVLQDAVTKLYNVTSKLNIPVPTNTLINISCLLHLGEQQGSLVSVPLVIGWVKLIVSKLNLYYMYLLLFRDTGRRNGTGEGKFLWPTYSCNFTGHASSGFFDIEEQKYLIYQPE